MVERVKSYHALTFTSRRRKRKRRFSSDSDEEEELFQHSRNSSLLSRIMAFNKDCWSESSTSVGIVVQKQHRSDSAPRSEASWGVSGELGYMTVM